MKTLFGKKGQMSIEMLLITSIIIMLSIGVFSYYTRTMDTTTAMEIIEIETLRQIDAKQGQYFMGPIGYKVDETGVYFCIEMEPGPAGLDTTAIEDAVEDDTGFAAGTVSVTENTPAKCQ